MGRAPSTEGRHRGPSTETDTEHRGPRAEPGKLTWIFVGQTYLSGLRPKFVCYDAEVSV